MNIDLNFNKEYLINDTIIIPKSYYENSGVLDIKNLQVNGRFYYDSENELWGDFDIDGILIIKDSISDEDVEYPISIKYSDILDETLKKDENTLDLFEFLWENIVLEIPLKFTKVMDLSEFHGDGWKLISEEDRISSSNPFNDLLKNFDKKEW
mgnify:FL=1